MRRFLLFIAFWLLNALSVYAQSTSIQLTTPAIQLCRGTDLTFYFTTTGSFEPGNSYHIQLAMGYYGTFQDIPGSVTSSPASIRLPDDLVIGQTYQLRLVSNNPTVYSNTVGPLLAQAVPTARLLGSSADSTLVNLGESVLLRLTLTGGEPYSVWLNDTLRFKQTLPADAYNSFRVVPEKTSTYRLTRVQNGCGAGQVSGTTSVDVSKVGFRLTKYPLTGFCPGDTLYPGFSTNTPLPASTQFSVDWIKPDGTISHTTTATIRKQSLVIPTPGTITGFYTNGSESPYKLLIRNTDLNIRIVLASAYLKPITTIDLTESVSVPFGQQAVLLAKATNPGGYLSLVMQDSSSASLVETLNAGLYRIFLQPLKTTEYSIKQLYTGGCDASAQLTGKATVTVTPGIRLDSLARTHLCAGDEASVFFTTNVAFSESIDDLVVEAGSASDDNKLTVRSTFPVIRLEPGKVVFNVPDNTAPGIYAIRLRRQRDSLTSSLLRSVYVNTRPTAILFSASQQLDKPGLYYMPFKTSGGTDDLEITLSDGTHFSDPATSWANTYDNTLSIQVPSTATYTIQSVRNVCGTGQATGQVSLTVSPPTTPTIQILTIGPRLEIPTQVLLCGGQQTTVQFAVTGPWPANTVYKVEMSNLQSDWSGLIAGRGSSSPITITLPSYTGWFKLRLVAEDGTKSNEVNINVNTSTSVSANLSLSYFGPAGISQQGATVTIPTYPKSVVYLNSSIYNALIKASSGPLNNKWIAYSYGLGEPDYPSANTTYTIQAVSKACVQQIFANQARVQIAPFLLSQGDVNQFTCPGNQTIKIPYTAVGEVPSGTRFMVDISEDNGPTRTLSVSGRFNYVHIPIDDLVPTKTYSLQLRAILPDQQIIVARKSSSINDKLTIRSPFTIALSAEKKQTTVELAPDQYATLYLNGNDTFDAVLSEGKTFTRESGVGFAVQPMKTTQYQIRSAWAECGYAVSNSSVVVRVQPGLRTWSLSSGSICRGQKLSLSFQAVGDFEPGHRFGIFVQRSGDEQWQLIAETTDVDFAGGITIPTSVRTGTYQVKVESSSTSAVRLSKELGIISIASSPDLVLSGSVTAYAGDLVRFVVPELGGDLTSLSLQGGSKPMIAQLLNNQLQFIATESATYQVSGIANGCGVGKATGSITVRILPSTSQTLRLTSAPATLCAGQTAQVRFGQTGSFGANNQFTVQLSDSTGANFKPLSTTGSGSPLTIAVPSTIASGNGYRLRVVSSNPVVEGTSSQQVVQLSAAVSGTLAGTNSLLKGDSTTLTLSFSGLPNWYYTLQNETGSLTGVASASPYRIRLRVDTTTTYKLVQVSTLSCGLGQPYGEAVLTVSPLTATEPFFDNRILVYPNPVSESLTIDVEVGKGRPLSIYLKDETGRILNERHYAMVVSTTAMMPMSGHPAGVYVLELVSGTSRSTKKILKQ